MTERESFSYLDLFVGDDWKIGLHTYADKLPALILNAGPAEITLKATGGDTVTGNTVSFARELLRNVQAFAAEVERLHNRPALVEPDELTGPAT